MHGQRYRQRLLDAGLREARVVYLPLLHGFLDHAHTHALKEEPFDCGVDRDRTALFFGRVGRYKGIDVLLQAWASLQARPADWRLVIAGQSEGGVEWPAPRQERGPPRQARA